MQGCGEFEAYHRALHRGYPGQGANLIIGYKHTHTHTTQLKNANRHVFRLGKESRLPGKPANHEEKIETPLKLVGSGNQTPKPKLISIQTDRKTNEQTNKKIYQG